MTVPVQGCGHQPIAGFTYCRKTEGYSTKENLTFFAPMVICDKPPCVLLKIYAPNGEPTLSLAFNERETLKNVLWQSLTGSPAFVQSNRGLWLYCLEITFNGPDKIEHKSIACGEIRLRVLNKDYTPLHNSKSDVNYAWIWKENAWIMKMTTNGRVFIGIDE